MSPRIGSRGYGLLDGRRLRTNQPVTRSELEARTGIAEHNLQLSEAKDIHLNS